MKRVKINADIKNARWLDNGKAIKVKKNEFDATPFNYGTSMHVRVARFELK